MKDHRRLRSILLVFCVLAHLLVVEVHVLEAVDVLLGVLFSLQNELLMIFPDLSDVHLNLTFVLFDLLMIGIGA